MIYLLGLDIGGTKTEALVADERFNVLGHVVHSTRVGGPDETLRGILATVEETLQESSLSPSQLSVIGVGIPGQVKPETGEVQFAVNLGLEAYPLGHALSEMLGVPVAVENDVRLAALGAYHLLIRQQTLNSLAYISVGTGIAAGLVLNGQLYRGASGMAGEIGHIVINEQGELCPCGQRGCLETVAAGPAIMRQIEQSGLVGQARSISDLLALRGNPEADALVAQVAHALARAIQWVVMACDVERVALGGGVTKAGLGLLHAIHAEMAAFREESALIRMMLPDERVTLLPEGINPGLYGAIRLAQETAKHKEPRH